MATKWLSKLTEEDLKNMQEYILGAENIVAGIRDMEDDGDTLSITFLENGWEEDDKPIEEPVETYYTFEDFNGIKIYDWSSPQNRKHFTQLFREWMLRHFGINYLDELIKETLGLNLIDYLDWSKTKEND